MKYYAHGKLLLSGEYLVLKGARALAIPTRYGQSLSFSAGGETIHWRSFDFENKLWFEAIFGKNLDIINTSDTESAQFLQGILLNAVELKKQSLPCGKVEMHLEFPRNWGLGSSSTLTHLIAQWLEIDPYKLFFSTQNGSGYDIACSTSATPLVYTLKDGVPQTETVDLPPAFEGAFFIHLNKKQNSRPAVTNFLKKDIADNLISSISDITDKMISVQHEEGLKQLMDHHEEIMSNILQTPTVKESLFNDFNGSIKSLGAWGGDFVMAIGENAPEYFKAKGFETIIPFSKMILK
ncbi:GYDIA family GHMP kinase [Owenweeksia hongkongensis]|uniref:GYDIA family GHMP kinase n=1 Tax=Owenweeksia hongkongensis TaxID=253245 RepID=UPI003A8C9001